MKSKWFIVKFLLGILILSFLVGFSTYRHATKELNNIEIKIDHDSGFYFVDENLVNKSISNEHFDVKNVLIGDLEIGNVESILEDNLFVKDAEVFKKVNGDLHIEIEQQSPIARIINDTEEYYLTEDLNKMPLSNLHSAEVILVGGNIVKEDFDGIKNIVDYLMADKLLKKHIIAIKKVRPNSFNLLINNGEYYIEFGDLTNIEDKFENLKLFYDQYLGKVGVNYYKSINLKFENQIVATKRDRDE